MMGRPSKIDPQIVNILVQAIQLGASRRVAAAAAGIHASTLFGWLARGREAESGIFKDFFDQIKRAEASCDLRCLSKIQEAAADGKWQAAAWLLERRNPEYQLNGPPPVAVHVDSRSVTVKQLIAELDKTEDAIQAIKGPVIDLDEE